MGCWVSIRARIRLTRLGLGGRVIVLVLGLAPTISGIAFQRREQPGRRGFNRFEFDVWVAKDMARADVDTIITVRSNFATR